MTRTTQPFLVPPVRRPRIAVGTDDTPWGGAAFDWALRHAATQTVPVDVFAAETSGDQVISPARSPEVKPDETPAYLSTRMVGRCSKKNYEVADTMSGWLRFDEPDPHTVATFRQQPGPGAGVAPL